MRDDNYHQEWSGNEEQQAMDYAFYNTVMYLPLDKIGKVNGLTVNEIIDEIGLLELEEDEKDMLNQVIEIRDNNDHLNYGEVTVDNYSGELGYNPDAISAAVFKNGNQNSVVYRGTPGGAWLDNSDNLNGVIKQFLQEKADTLNVDMSVFQYLSDFDVQTLEYYQKVYGDYVDKNGQVNLDVAGHSKGGHEAMLVALLYPELVNTCYAFDGQGIPPEIWRELEKLYDREKLDEIRDSIYGINVNNDYVHILGWTEEYGYIPGHLFIIEGYADCLTNPAANHFIQAFWNAGIFNSIDPNGEGKLARFLMAVSNEIMKVDPADRKVTTDSIMLICQAALGKKWPVGRSFDDIIDVLSGSKEGLGEALEIIKRVLRDPEINNCLAEYINELEVNEMLEWGIIWLIRSQKGKPVSPRVKSEKDFVEFLNETANEIMSWAMDKANRLLAAIEKGLKHIGEMSAAAIKKLGEFAQMVTAYIKNMAQEFAKVFENICIGIRVTLDGFTNKVGEMFVQWGENLKATGQKFIQAFTEIHNEMGRKGAVLMQRVKEICEERKRYLGFFQDANGRIVLRINPDNPFTEQTREWAAKTLALVEKAEQAAAEAARTIKDSVGQGITVLKESMNKITEWLKQSATAGLSAGQFSMSSGLNGISGIEYSALTQVQMLISQYIEDAKKAVWRIDGVIEDLSRLRYASFNTGSLGSAKHSIEKQRSIMGDHSERLESYRKVCQEAEQEFIQAMKVSFTTI